MAAVLAQSESELSDCPLLSLLPRTLSSSCPAGVAMSESKELDSISNFFKSTAQKGSTDLLEQAQMVWKINHPSIPNGQIEDVESISNKSTGEDQIELQGRRNRQRRPGLPGSERGTQVFNFSAKTTTFESSQMGAIGLLKRSNFTESNSEQDRESWPVIDYSCLEHISDPVEYFSTYRKLENAEKEVQRLKGESYQTLSKPHGRKDRQRRPGIPEHNRKKSVFKFPGMTAAVVDTCSLSNNSNYTELTNSSCSKAINQTESSEILALESRLGGNAEIHDSEGDEDTNELEKLMSTCRELDESGIANLVQETLQIKPINVEKLRTPAVSTKTQYNLGSSQICKVAPAIASTSSILKRRFSLINHQDDPFFSPNCNKQNGDGCKQTDDSDKIKSNFKGIYDNYIEHSQEGERDNQIGDSEKPRPSGKDLSDFVVAKLGKETLKIKLPDAEKIARPVDHSSILPNPNLLMDIHGRLAEISNLKRRILSKKSPESQQWVFNGNDSRDSSVSKSWEMHSLSPIPNESYQNAQNASIPVFLNGRKLEFEDKMQCPIDETTGTDKYISSMNISEDPKRCLNSLLEAGAVQTPDRALNKNEFLSSGSGIILEEVGQEASASVNCGPSKILVNPHQHFGNPGITADAGFHLLGNPSTADVNIAIQEDILDVEAAKDDDLSNEMAPLDKGLEISSNLLEGTNVNQKHQAASGNIENKKTRRNATSRWQKKRSSLLTRKSLAGAGTAWESGVRRSTRIKMKPLQHWCGERFLYGRVHDSLPTVIGVKKYGTPLQDGTRAMKVKSYVSEKYADLVVQAALY